MGLDHSANIFGKITVGGSSAAGSPIQFTKRIKSIRESRKLAVATVAVPGIILTLIMYIML